MAGLSSVNEATPCAAVTLTAARAAVITRALADAEHHRRESAEAWCAACAAAAPDEGCPDHTGYFDRARQYRDLATELVHVLTQCGRP